MSGPYYNNHNPRSLAGFSARTQFEMSGRIEFKETISSSEFSSFVSRHGGSLRRSDNKFGCYQFSGTAFSGDAWFPCEAAARSVRTDILRETCRSSEPEHRRCSISYRG